MFNYKFLNKRRRKNNYNIQSFPKSRLATIDICEIGRQKHHIPSLIELDVTLAKEKITAYNKANKIHISFTAWLLSIIAKTLKKHDTATAFLSGKLKRLIYNDINISVLFEKEIQGQLVPLPLIIEKAQEKNLEVITNQIEKSKKVEITQNNIVLQKKAERLERFYYRLPAFLRRLFWKYLLSNPQVAYNKMGNVAFTSIGMIGQVNGWFIPISVHPVSFGVSSITKQPRVNNDKIEIREVLKMTILFDHDVIDGAPIARFLSDLTIAIENADSL